MIDLYMGLRRDHPQIRAGALRRAAGAYKIVLKRVDLINCDDVFELIAVPRRQLGDKTLDRLGGGANLRAPLRAGRDFVRLALDGAGLVEQRPPVRPSGSFAVQSESNNLPCSSRSSGLICREVPAG